MPSILIRFLDCFDEHKNCLALSPNKRRGKNNKKIRRQNNVNKCSYFS